MRRLRCFLADLAPGEGPPALAAHRESCLRCQAAGARERALGRALGALRDEVVAAPPGLQMRVLARLGRQDAFDPRRALIARAAARYAAAAGLAGATLAALLAGVLRRHSRALG
ncbi:MAG: hypothetical protein FJW79_02240 [Actinobacteria bacterium]|nr:hypothetical protein [Actinomycetota bacterium]